jgi:hypothetical protein
MRSLRSLPPAGNFSRLLMAACAVALFLTATAGQPRVNPKAAALKEFSDRVKKYVDLHKKLEGELPKLPDKADAAAMEAHKTALANAIRAARADAKPGDIFFEEVRKNLVEILRKEIRGPKGKEITASVREGNPKVEAPTKPVPLQANARYPEKAPLSSVPPSVLLNFPKLPEEVEYRFVGRDLILHDVAANLIVDFIREAVPHL